MLSATEAAHKAASYFEEVSGKRVELTIEEIEIDDAGDWWFITLGIGDQYGIGGLGSKPRNYKIFKVDANTGDIKSMKIRQV